MFSIEKLTLGAAVVASAVSLYGIFQNSRWTKKQINAEVVAKSRIEWIQNSRIATADFINAVYNLISYHPRKTTNRNNSYGTRRNEDYTVEYSGDRKTKRPNLPKDKTLKELKNEVNRTGNLLSLMFGPSLKQNKKKNDVYINDLIVRVIQDVVMELTNNNTIRDRPLSNSDLRRCKRMIKDLSEMLRLYYKVEWLRSTGALKDKEVKNKFEGNELYINFVDKYRDSDETRESSNR